MNPLISIIVPVFRVEKYLDKCIQSIINQTYKNIEIILVDDGSDDRCGEICDRYARIDKRIKVVHKKNEGLNNARKSGVKISTGKYIGYVDGDDWIEPDMYEALLYNAIKYNVDVVECGVIKSNDMCEENVFPYLEQGQYKNERFSALVEPQILYTGDFFQSAVTPYLCSKLFLRKNLIQYQLMEGEIQNVLNDNLVTYPTIINTKSLYVLQKCLYHYRLNNHSIKHSINKRDLYLLQAYAGYKSRLNGIFLTANADKQIQYFCMYHLLCRIPFVFDARENDKILAPYGGIDVNSRIVLYGAGSVGIHLYCYIKGRKDTNLICWVDKNYKVINQQYDVCDPENILNVDYDYIVISIMKRKAVNEVYKRLREMKIEERKILWIKEDYLQNPSKLLSLANQYDCE